MEAGEAGIQAGMPINLLKYNQLKSKKIFTFFLTSNRRKLIMSERSPPIAARQTRED
jgi:hypothetical protein